VREVADQKIKKNAGELTLTLVKNPDILGSARGEFGFKGYLAGFAAETENLPENAWEKMRRKGCDLLVANDVSRSDIGFDQDENEVHLFFSDGRQEAIARSSKSAIAALIIEAIEREA
jgi:phosphopantothenate-cysteine ligase/phosphopantothenoylcysteine decarboxylase/phosphopantothenate--cysteine ligase